MDLDVTVNTPFRVLLATYFGMALTILIFIILISILRNLIKSNKYKQYKGK